MIYTRIAFASWINPWQPVSWHLRLCDHTFVAVSCELSKQQPALSTQVHSHGVPHIAPCLTPSPLCSAACVTQNAFVRNLRRGDSLLLSRPPQNRPTRFVDFCSLSFLFLVLLLSLGDIFSLYLISSRPAGLRGFHISHCVPNFSQCI